MNPDRIDVHQHVVPPFWAGALDGHGGDPSGWASPDWSPDSALAFMDENRIATGLLSLTAPGVSGWEGAARREMAARVNDYAADLVARRPGRFGSLATLPLPDIDGARRELERALGGAGADGAILLSNYEGKYLGDPLYEPLWAELDQRGAAVFVHPGKPAIPVLEGIPGPVIDYPFDTTRTAVHMVVNGVKQRFPRAKVILAHAGGFLPYASHRFAELLPGVNEASPSRDDLLAAFRSFDFDTALSTGPAALPSLLAFAGADRVLFGSDFPYAPASVGASFARKLDGYADLSPAARERIDRGTGRALFPRLAAR